MLKVSNKILHVAVSIKNYAYGGKQLMAGAYETP